MSPNWSKRRGKRNALRGRPFDEDPFVGSKPTGRGLEIVSGKGTHRHISEGGGTPFSQEEGGKTGKGRSEGSTGKSPPREKLLEEGWRRDEG